MAKARGFPFHGTAAAARTSTAALGDAEPIFGCAKDAGYGPGVWNGFLDICREQLQHRPAAYASIALSRKRDSLLVVSRCRVHGDVLPPTQLF